MTARLLASLSLAVALVIGVLVGLRGAATSEAAPSDNFVKVCGTKLCLNGKVFRIHGGTTYAQLDHPVEMVALAKRARLNTLEIVEYEVDSNNFDDLMSERTWARIDRFIAEAKRNGVKILLNFSSYAHGLEKVGLKAVNEDWGPFLSFVMNRVNTATGIRYADEPAIAKIHIYAEVQAPAYPSETKGTTEETTAFFQRTLAQLRALDFKHVISSGGFLYINNPDSGIDWRTIMADPNNQTCDIEMGSAQDRDITVPNVTAYCKQIGKPWLLSAWSACQGTSSHSDDISNYQDDQGMAGHASRMYQLASSKGSIGSVFWNFAEVPARVGSCDIGPQYPLTFRTVQIYAPALRRW